MVDTTTKKKNDFLSYLLNNLTTPYSGNPGMTSEMFQESFPKAVRMLKKAQKRCVPHFLRRFLLFRHDECVQNDYNLGNLWHWVIDCIQPHLGAFKILMQTK